MGKYSNHKEIFKSWGNIQIMKKYSNHGEIFKSWVVFTFCTRRVSVEDCNGFKGGIRLYRISYVGPPLLLLIKVWKILAQPEFSNKSF